MMETDQLNEAHGIGREDGSPTPQSGKGKPMRQLEFNQAMSDFRHMFPETDEEVIEAVLRANSGMVDATIDQLLTMNIDAEQVREMYEDDDDLPDHILMSVEQEVMAQEQSSRESRSKKRQLGHQGQGDLLEKTGHKELEDCPPSYTEAVKSHLSHHHRSSNHRHRHSPTSGGQSSSTSPKNNAINSRSSGSHHHHHHRYNRNGMQHLLDLGPESAPMAAPTGPVDGQVVRQQSQHGKYHAHHHSQRASNHHHRRRGDSMDSASPHKSRPGRNLLASNSVSSSHAPFASHQFVGADDDFGYPRQRRSSLDGSDFGADASREKSPSRWSSSYREKTSPKRPAFRNWNPPLLGTLPDDFLRITPAPSVLTSVPSQSVSFRAAKQGNTHLHRTVSAVGPERPKFSSSVTTELRPIMSTSHFQPKPKSSNKPHRSLSFAGHSSDSVHQRKAKSSHPSGLAQHEFSPDFLQERMKENERRQLRMGSSGLDPELAQYLADERLAIMLQNSEFLQELRGDQQFMMTLERDHKDVEEGLSAPKVVPEPINTTGLNSDEEEGYGEDRRDTLEAFPFTQQLPAAKNEDVELRKKLKHMGKASRKQFAALARKFFSKRKKKTAHQILKESQAPSMMNLLDEDEDPEFDDLENNHHFGSINQESSYPSKSSSWNERHHHDDL